MRKIPISKCFGILLMILALALVGCEGDDGARGPQGEPGVTTTVHETVTREVPCEDCGPVIPADEIVDVVTTSPEDLAEITLEENPTDILDVTIGSPPVVRFRVKDSEGRNILGIEQLNAEDDRFVRFTLAKLVPAPEDSGDPSKWVPYILNGDTPSYDAASKGGVLTVNDEGVYTYTFATDVTAVPGVPYDETLTHRLGGADRRQNFGTSAHKHCA